MKIPYYFGLFVLLFANVGNSYSSYPNTNLVEQIKPNPMARSKPTVSYPKYASVQFLTSDTQLTFSSDKIGVAAKCASLGYMVPVSKCTGSLKPSYLCSSDLHEAGAEGYTTNCCNSNLYTVSSPDMCTDNATALTESCYWGGSKKYRCACDRSRYPYSELSGEGCGSNGDFNVNNMCKAPDATGRKISYYGSCCPRSYEECDGSRHLVGKGNSCRVSKNGTIVNKYEYCECSSSYDTICADAMLIDSSDVCTDGKGRKFTRDNNCESGCTQTRETNIDSYLYGKVWHCLYKNDGASIKTSEGRICDGYNQLSSAVESNYYDECTAQGYVKTVEDCYISDLILHCPSDTSKVWCLDSKYCTGFPVSGAEVCDSNAAKISFCGSRDKGVRCSYNDERCNKCWNDGVFDWSKCPNYDTSDKGDSEVCCKRGYIMKFTADRRVGACVKNVCDRNKFPYDLDPGSDQGVLELCYQGNPSAENGYDVYYGYSSCYDDPATGGMWKQADDNSRKCVCERNDDARGWLPFDLSLYFDSNVDTSENYIHVGFNQGIYGAQRSCTDSEGSYYGYSSCYIGSQLGTIPANKGMCLQRGNDRYSSTYPYRSDRLQGITYLNRAVTSAGITAITRPYRVTAASKPENIYCINKNTHCPNGVCDSSVRALLVEGCDNGWEEACSLKCYHVSNLVKEGSAYKAHGKYKLAVNSYENASYANLGFEVCPSGFTKGGNSSQWGNCFKYCSISNISACEFGDVLRDASGNTIGVVFAKDGVNSSCGTSGQLHIVAHKNGSWKTWADANTWIKAYAPANVTNTCFAAGRWRFPTTSEFSGSCVEQFSMYAMNGTLNKIGGNFESSWSDVNSGGMSSYRNCCGTQVYAVTNTRIANPVITIPYGNQTYINNGCK